MNKWLFILGCNNSGTTLLNYLLGLHPDIDPLKDEGHTSPHMPDPSYPDGKGATLRRVWSEQADLFRTPKVKNISTLKKSWLSMRRTVGGIYTMEKSPPDALRSLWLQMHFSPAWFVGIIRNGYAVCEGIKRKKGASVNYERAARHWDKTNRIMLEDSRHLHHFILVKYEDLVEKTEEVLHSLEEFLNLPHHNYSNIGVVDLGYPQFHPSKIMNMNQKSFDNLTDIQVTIIKENASEVLDYFGYEAQSMSSSP